MLFFKCNIFFSSVCVCVAAGVELEDANGSRRAERERENTWKEERPTAANGGVEEVVVVVEERR